MTPAPEAPATPTVPLFSRNTIAQSVAAVRVPDEAPRWKEDADPTSASQVEPAAHATLEEILGTVDVPANSLEATATPAEASKADELARQMALLSPRAARALASSDDHASGPDDERERLSTFPGSD